MMLENTVNYAGAPRAPRFWNWLIASKQAVASSLAILKEKRDQADLYKAVSSLSGHQLRDIGCHDPQVQLHSFGRYLDDSSTRNRCFMFRAGGLTGSVWHY